MRNRTKLLATLLALAVLSAIGITLAQALPPGLDPGQPATWFLTAAGWGFMVMFAVNFLKANVLHVTGWGTIGVAAALAFGGPLLASTGLLAGAGITLSGSLPELLAYGLTAFTTSAGSWDSIARLKAIPAKRAA